MAARLWHCNCQLGDGNQCALESARVSSMNRRLFTVLATAFVVAALCSYLVYRVVGGRLMAAAQHRTTPVVVAKTNIQLGSVLKETDLTTTPWVGVPPAGAILRVQDAVGRGVVSDLYQGETVMENRLAALGSGGGLAATIRPGMRACAVKVNDVVGVAGFVTPGMHVDVLVSGNPPGSNANSVPRVRTILQNIEVLSAGTDISKDAEGKPQQVQVVNLLVTPEEAELLSLAGSESHIQLVLRNPLDRQFTKPPGTTMASLFGDAPAKVQPATAPRKSAAKAPRVYLVEVINGSKRSEEKFVANEDKQ
jgi:pilus assembly protein CpaB